MILSFSPAFNEGVRMLGQGNRITIPFAIVAAILVAAASFRGGSRAESNATIPTQSPVADAEYKLSAGQQLWLAMDEAEKQGRYEDALACNRAIRANHGDYYLVNFRAGRLYASNADYRSAIEAYRRASALSPGAISPLNALAACYVSLGQIELAINTSLAVLVIDPMNNAANRRLADLYFQRKEYSAAETYCAKLLYLTPEDLDLGAQYAWCLFHQGKPEQAKAVFASILAASPAHASSLAGWNACEAAKPSVQKAE